MGEHAHRGGTPAPRVLYVIHHHEYSGAETLHVPLLEADPHALVACPPGSRTEELARAAGADTVALPFRELRHSGGPLETLRSMVRGLVAARDIRRILRRHADRSVVYCIALRPGMLSSLAALGLRRTVIWYVPDFMPPWPVRAITLLLAWLGCDRVIAISDCVARDAARGGAPAEITVIHPGIDRARFDPSRARPGTPRAAIVGHISPTKRTDLAVDIAERVAREVPGFTLSVLGRAQYRDEDFALERTLRARVGGDPALTGIVSFEGYAGDVGAALAGFGLLLHCRPDEPFGMVLLEAMAAGLPVVAPRGAGPLEIVEDGVTGFLFEPGDPDDAAACVLKLVRDPALARRMGAAGGERVGAAFDASRQTGMIATAVGIGVPGG